MEKQLRIYEIYLEAVIELLKERECTILFSVSTHIRFKLRNSDRQWIAYYITGSNIINLEVLHKEQFNRPYDLRSSIDMSDPKGFDGIYPFIRKTSLLLDFYEEESKNGNS